MTRYDRRILAVATLVAVTGISAATAGLPAYQTAVRSEPSLISYYTFDGDSTAVADTTPSGNNGALAGTAAFTVGVGGSVDQALNLDGGGWVTFSPVTAFEFIDGTGTVEAWIHPTWAGGDDRVIVASRNGGPVRYSIHVGGGRGFVNSYTGYSWSRGDASLTADRWYHVAVVFDAGNKMRVYVDGRPAPVTYAWTPYYHYLGPDLGQPFQIGASAAAGNTENFVGQLDEVALYADALPGPDIIKHLRAFQGPAISVNPASTTFRLPDDAGPKSFTLSLPSAAGAGGVAITLSFDDTAIQVTDAADNPIANGGSVTVAAGHTDATIKVTAYKETGPAPGLGAERAIVATGGGFTEAVLLYAATRLSLTVTPSSRTFVSPGDLGPDDVVIGMSGAVAGPGGTPITLTYDSKVISVKTTGGTTIPSGGTVTIPEGAGSVTVKVSGVGPGTTTLTAANSGFVAGTASFGTEYPPSAELAAYQALIKSESSLIGYFTFDADTTQVANQSPAGGPSGTLVGTTAFSGRQEGGRVLQLSGGGLVAFPAGMPGFDFPSGKGTVEAWVWPTWPVDGGTNDYVVTASRNGGPVRYSAHMRSNRRGLNSWTGASWNEMGFPFVENRWYHIAYVYDSGNLRCYVDGLQIGSVAHTLGSSMGQTFQIGASAAGGNAENFRGGIDEVAIYSDALTSTKLLQHFNTLKPRFTPPTAATSLLTTYQSTVLAEPSLLSYYTFEGDTTAVSDKKGPYHGTLVDLTEWTDGFAGGQALGLQTYGHVSLGNVDDFKFSDGTGTIEAWVNPTGVGLGLGNKSVFAGRDNTLNRYTMHVNTSNGDMGIATTGNTGGTYLETPAGTIAGNTWQHVVAVFSNDGTTNRTTLYVNGVPLVNSVPQILGTLDASSFQIGAGRPDGGFRFLGRIDELAVYSEPLTAEQVAAHFNTTALTFSINEHDFVLPSQPGPIAVTLSLPLGTVAPVGGTAVTLAFNDSILEVSAGGVPIVPGGQVVVPPGESSVELAIKAVGLGGTNLEASAPEALFGCTAVFRVRLGDQGIIIVDDHFDDNPGNIPTLDSSALTINDQGAGGGWNLIGSGKTQRERGTSWEALSDGGNWALAGISGKNEDEFKFMTDQGIRVEWVIHNVTVTVDNTDSYSQHPGGEFADVRHEFGIVSANRVNTGNNELYVNTSGGLYVNLYYSASGAPPTQSLVVTGSVRAVNNTHTGGDTEDLAGLETLATFTLTGITQISPSSPLSVTMEADKDGWEIGFSPNANPEYLINAETPGVHTVPVAKLAGGWDATSLYDAAITTEFLSGGFPWAHFQNMGIGRGSGSVDRVKVCIGCKLSTDCPDPFADADRDGDVDQVDFGLMQLCFTGDAGGTPPGCRCFDRNEDGSITGIDVAAFVHCAADGGPMLPADPTCDD